MSEYLYLNANSRRARYKLPASAKCCIEHLPNRRGFLPQRYVYRVPVVDFDPRILGGSYHGKISKARVIEANVRECWSH
jgi:hypothetical protein